MSDSSRLQPKDTRTKMSLSIKLLITFLKRNTFYKITNWTVFETFISPLSADLYPQRRQDKHNDSYKGLTTQVYNFKIRSSMKKLAEIVLSSDIEFICQQCVGQWQQLCWAKVIYFSGKDYKYVLTKEVFKKVSHIHSQLCEQPPFLTHYHRRM